MELTERLAEIYQYAEPPTEKNPMREGDEYIADYYRSSKGEATFIVGVAWESGAYFGVDPRIVKRAPEPVHEPNPWDGLTSHLESLPGCLSNAEIAENLYETGWLEGRSADPTGGDRDGA